MAYMRNVSFGFKGKNCQIAAGGGGGAGTNYAQFTPGHYILLNLNAGTVTNNVITGGFTSYTTVKTEIKNRPALQGVQLRYYWNQLEASKGEWTFSDIGAKMDDFADSNQVGVNKKLIILLATGAGGGVAANSAHVVPNYMLSTTTDKMGPGSDGVDYDGGQWGYNGVNVDGYRIRLANANVSARFNIMLTNLCQYIRSHPNYSVVESICLSESVVGDNLAGWTQPNETDTLENSVAAAMVMDAALPERMIHLMVNFPRSTTTAPGIDYLEAQLLANKMGFGSPDVFWDKPDLWSVANASGKNEGALVKMSTYPGARLPSVQEQDQRWTNFPVNTSAGHAPTFLENYNNAVTLLNPHYMIWQRATQTDPHNAANQLYQTMLTFFNTPRPLNTTRPTLWKTY